jgi:VWFA-related protein
MSPIQKRQASTLACHYLIALTGILVVPLIVAAQGSQSTQIGSGEGYTLRLNANMVVLSATVLDRHNASVSGLVERDFQIYENGKLQQIRHFNHDDLPVTAGILVDNSGSMGPKRDDVISAALTFARFSNPLDQMFVVNFNDRVSFGLPPGMLFTDRRDELQLALSTTKTIGQTALYDGVIAALDHLNLGTRDKKVLVLISDGGDNASKHTLAQVLDIAKQTTATIYAIGIFDDQDGDQNPGVLKRLARETGGEAFFPESSKEVALICEGIAGDIRSQYTLAYVPAIAEQDGRYRSIEIRANSLGRGRLSVRTRTGYSVPLKTPADAAKAIVHDSKH